MIFFLSLKGPLIWIGRQTSAISWYENMIDFADALHLASSRRCVSFATFDVSFFKKAQKLSSMEISQLRMSPIFLKTGAPLPSSRMIYDRNAQSHQDHAADQTQGDAFTQKDVAEDNTDNRCGEMKHPHVAGDIALVEFCRYDKTDTGDDHPLIE